jgi:hypothetical protein
MTMITYSYFGIDYEFDENDFSPDGDAMMSQIHTAAKEAYEEQSLEVIAKHFAAHVRSKRIANAIIEFTTVHREFPDSASMAIVFQDSKDLPDNFHEKYRVVVATGFEDRETGEIRITEFF